MIKIVGAGTDASTGTRLTMNNTSNEPISGGCCAGFIFWLNHNLSRLEISNIRFIQGSSWGNSDEEAVWAIILAGHADTQASQIRIHHNHFEQKAGNIVNSIRIGGNNSYSSTYETSRPYIWGVIDHNTWHSGGVAFQGIDVIPNASFYTTSQLGSSYLNDGHDAWWLWELSDHQGTWRNLFFEDNTVQAETWGVDQAFLDSVGGGTYVARYNTFKNNWVANHGFEGYRSVKWMEIYQNDFVLDDTGSGYTNALNTRGGSAVVYDNRFWDGSRKGSFVGSGTNTWKVFLEMEYYRGSIEARGASPQGDTWCHDFTQPLGEDNRDITSGADKGWLCADQPGARKGASQPTWLYRYQWAQEPLVAWNNQYTSVRSWDNSEPSAYLVARRDYIDDGNATCAGHMGETICANFWDATNHKKLNYTAYTYPHPLVSGAASPPAPPQNLRVQ
jgi:hypothetical protein